MCPFFCHSRDVLIQYLVRRHRNAPNLIVHCSAPGCGASFANLVSFRVHCFRKHFRDEEPTNLSDDELDIDFETNNDTELAQNDSNLAKKISNAQYILKLKSQHNLTQSAINEIIDSTKLLIKDHNAIIQTKLTNSMLTPFYQGRNEGIQMISKQHFMGTLCK
ncbi:unnamed protein product [Mytilus edulis]|uniref:C2H2-type domain-containing protein n=1 Tax=Mytilus edulis TaxID=6550 RepID=A0A8S3S8Y3_MYTED|nr:unnamed protein product [Mytilus edulis]